MSKHWGPQGEMVAISKRDRFSIATKLLSTNGYILYNRFIAKKLGVEAAILLGYMCHLAEVYGNGFYCQQERLIEDTALTEYSVKIATSRLVKAGILSVEKKGLPAKNEYTVLDNGIFDLLSGLENAPTSQVTLPVDANSPDKTNREEYIYNNNVGGNGDMGDTTRTHAKRFTPPTLSEVQAYCAERRNGVDPQYFIDFYASKGWKVGKDPMVDWKASVRTWERNNSGSRAAAPQRVPDRVEYTT